MILNSNPEVTVLQNIFHFIVNFPICRKVIVVFQNPKTISLWHCCYILVCIFVRRCTEHTERLKKKTTAEYFLDFLLHIHQCSVFLGLFTTSELMKRMCERNVLPCRKKRETGESERKRN